MAARRSDSTARRQPLDRRRPQLRALRAPAVGRLRELLERAIAELGAGSAPASVAGYRRLAEHLDALADAVAPIE